MPVHTEPDQIRRLVGRELALIADPGRRTAIERLLVDPRRELRGWDYGGPGESYPYWVVAESPDPGLLLVYCEHGFGPDMPWGFLPTNEPEFDTLGMDSQWGWYLEEAFVKSGLWGEPTAADEFWHLPPERRFSSGAPRDA
jgi:hypothetical protein